VVPSKRRECLEGRNDVETGLLAGRPGTKWPGEASQSLVLLPRAESDQAESAGPITLAGLARLSRSRVGGGSSSVAGGMRGLSAGGSREPLGALRSLAAVLWPCVTQPTRFARHRVLMVEYASPMWTPTPSCW